MINLTVPDREPDFTLHYIHGGDDVLDFYIKERIQTNSSTAQFIYPIIILGTEIFFISHNIGFTNFLTYSFITGGQERVNEAYRSYLAESILLND